MQVLEVRFLDAFGISSPEMAPDCNSDKNKKNGTTSSSQVEACKPKDTVKSAKDLLNWVSPLPDVFLLKLKKSKSLFKFD